MKKIIPLILFFTLLIIAAPLYADYKIILKNGREFVVDDYKDLDGKIRFYREGGEIELDKSIIKDIKKTGSSCKSMGKLMNFKKYNMASNKEKRAFKGIKKSV